MFKRCMVAITVVFFLSANVYANDDSYKIEIKETNDESVISANVKIGKILPIQKLKGNNEDSVCDIKIENEGFLQELNIGTRKSDGVSVIVYPISISDNNIKTILVYDKVGYDSLDRSNKPVDISDNCKFYNTNYSLKNSYVQWNGELKLNETAKIKLSNSEDIFVKITKNK